MPKPDGGVHNESTVESLSLALVSAQKMDNETLFTNLYIYLAYTIHKVTVPATFIVLWPDLSPKLGKELPSFSDFVAIIFCGVGGGGEEEYIATTIIAPYCNCCGAAGCRMMEQPAPRKNHHAPPHHPPCLITDRGEKEG